MRRRWSWLPALLLALVACAPSGTLTRNQRILLEPAQAAEQRGDDAAAFAAWRRAAEDDIAYAQSRLADKQGYERAAERIARLAPTLDEAALQAADELAAGWRSEQGQLR